MASYRALFAAAVLTVGCGHGVASHAQTYPPEGYAPLLFDPADTKYVFRLNGMPWICRGDTFCKPVKIDGVSYCHLFVKGANGRVTNQKFGMPNARTQVLREMHSCTAGHKPGLDVHIQPVGSGSMRGIIAGSCYQHEEEYMTPQGTTYWRGILVKHEVHEGNYDLMEVSLKYLLRKYT